jgi:hypothetical protein
MPFAERALYPGAETEDQFRVITDLFVEGITPNELAAGQVF